MKFYIDSTPNGRAWCITACRTELQQFIPSVVVITADDFHFFFRLIRLMQLLRSCFYYEYCRVYLASSVFGTRDIEVWLSLVHTWRRFLSATWRCTWNLLCSIIVLLLLLLLLLLYTIYFREGNTGISCMCSPIITYFFNIPQFPRCDIDVQQGRPLCNLISGDLTDLSGGFGVSGLKYDHIWSESRLVGPVRWEKCSSRILSSIKSDQVFFSAGLFNHF